HTHTSYTIYIYIYIYIYLVNHDLWMAHKRRKREKKGSNASPLRTTRSVASYLARPQVVEPSPMASQADSWLEADSQPLLSTSESQAPVEESVLLDKFKTMLQQELASTAATITADITKQLHELGQRTDAIEHKVDDITTVLDAHENDILDLQMQLREVWDKIEDADNRSRRNNLRIRGIPETVTDLPAAVESIFTSLLPNLPPERLECDRIHRALRPMREGDPPRDIILRLHYHQTQVATLQAARQKDRLEYQGTLFQIYTDLAPITLQKRKALAPITKILQQHRIRYRWLFPVKLAFLYNSHPQQISTVQAGLELLSKLGLHTPSNESPRQPPKSRRIDPIWERVQGSQNRITPIN
uniref:L1 transposable element RRM domain-containing protein n=2 Tax=Xenopus tropicalis TaxID=8364 RepID=A0A803KD14_XENTR